MPIDYRLVSVRYGTVPSRSSDSVSDRVSRARSLIQTTLSNSSGHGLPASIEGFLRDEVPLTDHDLRFSATRCTITIQAPAFLKDLPAPYGIKGGVPRELVAAIVHGREFVTPRDVDIVRLGRSAKLEDDVVAKQWMPDDFARGHGVELIRDLDSYFKGRDVTVNEVVLFDRSLTMSLMAFMDTVAMTYRPCRYRLGSLHRSAQLLGGTALKMIRLWSEAQIRDEPWQVVGIPEHVHIREIDLAVQIGKALERSRECAELFVSQCEQIGFLTGWTSGCTVDDILEELSYLGVGERSLISPDLLASARQNIIPSE